MEVLTGGDKYVEGLFEYEEYLGQPKGNPVILLGDCR